VMMTQAESNLGNADTLLQRARELMVSAGNGSYGDSERASIADELQSWFENEGADGFNIMPPHLPGGLTDFIELVLPELRRRGLFRTEYEGRTLRENLGLRYRANRYFSEGAPGRVAAS